MKISRDAEIQAMDILPSGYAEDHHSKSETSDQ